VKIDKACVPLFNSHTPGYTEHRNLHTSGSMVSQGRSLSEPRSYQDNGAIRSGYFLSRVSDHRRSRENCLHKTAATLKDSSGLTHDRNYDGSHLTGHVEVVVC
jgi:hypothetical protein